MSLSDGPLPSYLFDVDYVDIMTRVERRIRSRIRRGMKAMFSDFVDDSEFGDVISDLRSGRLTTATLYRSFDAIVGRTSLMDEPVRQAIDSAGLSVMRIAGRDVGEALGRWKQRSTTSYVAGDVRFDSTDPALISDLRQTGDLFWSSLLNDTIKTMRDEVERSYYDNDSGGAMADRLEMAAGLAPHQAQALDRVRKTLAKGPLSPAQKNKALKENAERMRASRAESITRTELNRVVNTGAISYWQQMSRRGALDYNTTLIKWNTHPDERTCEVCGPLNGATTVFGGQFTPGVISPPIHPHCRCSLELTYQPTPSVVIEKIDRDGDGDGWVDDGKPTMRPAIPRLPLSVRPMRPPRPTAPAKRSTAVKRTRKVIQQSNRHQPDIVFGRSQDEIEASIGIDNEHLYRVISETDYQRIITQGVLNTDGRGNIHMSEGTVAARGRVAWSYLGDVSRKGKDDNPTGQGRVIKIRLDSNDGWRQGEENGDYWKNREDIPADRIVSASMPIGVRRIVTDPDSGSFRTIYDFSDQPVDLGVSVPEMTEYNGEREVTQDHLRWANPKYQEWKKKAEAAYGSTVRGEPISADDELVPDFVYHVTPALDGITADGKIAAGGMGGLGGDDRDRIVSMTTSRQVAEEIVADMRMLRDVAAMDLSGEDLISYLRRLAEKEGVTIPDQKWDGVLAESQRNGTAAAINAYLWTRDIAGGRRNPLFVGLSGLLKKWTERPPSKADIGIIKIPRKNLKTGAQLTNFDIGEGFLEEIRLYGDVPVSGATIIPIEGEGAAYRIGNLTKRRTSQFR